jgi:hypothetical protein
MLITILALFMLHLLHVHILRSLVLLSMLEGLLMSLLV